MARKRSRRQAKPTELIVGYVVAGMGLLAAGGFVMPQHVIVPVVILLACVIALIGVWFYYFVYLKEQARREALVQLSVDQVDEMTGVEFENYVEALLRRDGYKTETTSTSGDYGVDLVAIKDKQRIAIQCKRYTKSIDQKAVREVYAGMTKYQCSFGVVITNRHFTKHAVELADSTNCILIDREKLALLASKHSTIDNYIQ